MQEPKLIVITWMSGRDDGKSVTFAKDIVSIGRLPENDIYIPDDRTVGRQHARIERRNGSYWLIDLNSKNHTYVNMHQTMETQLTDGMLFAISGVLSRGLLIGAHWFKLSTLPAPR